MKVKIKITLRFKKLNTLLPSRQETSDSHISIENYTKNKFLDFSQNSVVTPKDAQKIAKEILEDKYVEDICLDNMSFCSKKSLFKVTKNASLYTILQTIFKKNSINKVSLQNCKIDLETFEKICKLAKKSKNKYLEIDLSKNVIDIETDDKTFFETFYKLPKNVKINLALNPCHEKVLLRQMIIGSGSADELDLSNQNIENISFSKIYKKIIEFNQQIPYKKIILSKNNLTEESFKKLFLVIEEIAKNKEALKVLALSDINIDNSSLERLLEIITFHKIDLKSLDISSNKISLLPINYAPRNSLQKLDLSHNKLSFNAIKTLFYNLNKIKQLYLSDTGINNKAISYIVDSLIKNQNLKLLDISENKIGNDGVKSLVKLIEGNKVLEYLLVENNEFDAKGLGLIAESIKNNQNLKMPLKCYIENITNGIETLGGNGDIFSTEFDL